MKHPLSPVYNGENRPKNDDTIRLWSSSAPLPRASSARARGSCSSISKPPIRELDVINSVFLEPPFFTNYYFGFSEGKHPWLDDLFFTNTGVLISSNSLLILRCGDWWGNCPVGGNSALGFSTSSAGRCWRSSIWGQLPVSVGSLLPFVQNDTENPNFPIHWSLYLSPTLDVLSIAFQ